MQKALFSIAKISTRKPACTALQQGHKMMLHSNASGTLWNAVMTIIHADSNINYRKMKMKESYCSVDLNFSTETKLVEQYINFYGKMYFLHERLGKLMEDMDLLAGVIAYKHCQNICNEENMVTIVTASVDKIELLKPLSKDFDIKLHGNVVHVGKSSMQVLIRMQKQLKKENENIESCMDYEGELLVEAKFTMVARDKNQNAAIVPQLEVENEEEKKYYDQGEAERIQRLNARATSTEKIPPSQDESQKIHDIFLFTRNKTQLPVDCIWMKDTVLSSTKVCHPQERNIHNFMFGGFLMREAYELAFAASMIYVQGTPAFHSLDEISFRKPVPIGSILNLCSQVVYTTADKKLPNMFRVTVTADILCSEKGTRETTNIFQFAFVADKPLRKVIPQTYSEAMLYIEGRRKCISTNRE